MKDLVIRYDLIDENIEILTCNIYIIYRNENN